MIAYFAEWHCEIYIFGGIEFSAYQEKLQRAVLNCNMNTLLPSAFAERPSEDELRAAADYIVFTRFLDTDTWMDLEFRRRAGDLNAVAVELNHDQLRTFIDQITVTLRTVHNIRVGPGRPRTKAKSMQDSLMACCAGCGAQNPGDPLQTAPQRVLRARVRGESAPPREEGRQRLAARQGR